MMGTVDPARFERLVLAHYGVALTVARSHDGADRSLLTPNDLRGRRVQVFTRNLNPGPWDMLHAPLFDFGDDDPGGSEVAGIPLRSQVAVAFQLLRSARPALRADGGFWEPARRRCS